MLMGNAGGLEIYFGKHQRNNSIDLSSCKKTACTCSLVYCFTRSTFQITI